jgi:hypothetical protein
LPLPRVGMPRAERRAASRVAGNRASRGVHRPAQSFARENRVLTIEKGETLGNRGSNEAGSERFERAWSTLGRPRASARRTFPWGVATAALSRNRTPAAFRSGCSVSATPASSSDIRNRAFAGSAALGPVTSDFLVVGFVTGGPGFFARVPARTVTRNLLFLRYRFAQLGGFRQ